MKSRITTLILAALVAVSSLAQGIIHPKVGTTATSKDGKMNIALVAKKQNFVAFDGGLLALWDDSFQTKDSLSYRLPVDYLLVTGKQKPDVQSIVNGYDAKLLLIDGSVPRYLAEKWVAQADGFGLPVYDLLEGAFEVDLGE